MRIIATISGGNHEHPALANGILLSRLHHAAFDAHLIGIDPDYRLHVADRQLMQKDGPVLEALKGLHGSPIHLPLRPRDYPDRGRLAVRYQEFQAAQIGLALGDSDQGAIACD